MKPIDIGSRRELFVDYKLIDKMQKTSLSLHQPQPREVVLKHDQPWEGPVSLYHTIINTGEKYLMYYRGWQKPGAPAVYCVAESDDGINFSRPVLNMHDWKGSRENNIFLVQEPFTHTFAPFLDTNPEAKEHERFKAFSRNFIGRTKNHKGTPVLNGFVSQDGINWCLFSEKPIITDGKFDSQNIGFWSETEQQYVAYYRDFCSKKDFASQATGPTTRAEKLRVIKRAVSSDFQSWETGVLMDYRTGNKPAPVEEFYINQTRPYFRAPHIYVALPARFMNHRPAISEEEAEAMQVLESQRDACSDACFMTTRAGSAWYDRTFMEGFIRPLPDPSHWSARSNYPVDGVIQTAPPEMSFYVDEHYAQPGNQVRRYSLRLDGFSSLQAPYGGGEMTTRPLVFSGSELELNYSTSAAGSMRVEIRDEDNTPIPGYTLREAVDIFGNKIAGRAAWKNGSNVAELAGKSVRLRFVMRDADLFSLRFV